MPASEICRPGRSSGNSPNKGRVESRFWGKVDRTSTPDGCWPWLGCTDSDGYGQLTVDGKTRRAHRVALEIALGRPLRDEEKALHGCDTPGCCRVADGHVHPGTQLENIRERDERGRTASGSRHYKSRLTEAQVSEIRRLGSEMGRGRNAIIARRFGVGQRCVSHILRGDNWHVAPGPAVTATAREERS